jgi:hypothetical protein
MAKSNPSSAQQRAPLRYPENLTSEILAEENGRRLRKLYRRLLNRTPVFDGAVQPAGAHEHKLKHFFSSATEPLMRELELQAAMNPEIHRAQLAQQPEFHNKPGRPTGSKTKNHCKAPKSEKEISRAAIRQRRRRARKA